MMVFELMVEADSILHMWHILGNLNYLMILLL